MKPERTNHSFEDSNIPRLSKQLNPSHPLCLLAELVEWEELEEEFGAFYSEGNSRPPKPIRLMTGLLMLQHMAGFSDEQTVRHWVENPYWQYFCGFDILQWKPPIDPSLMSHFRKRIGKAGMEKILEEVIKIAIQSGFVCTKDLSQVIVDTTVMEKNIAYPTDARLYFKMIENLIKMARKTGIAYRQSYARVTKHLLLQIGRHLHAKQMKRAKKKIKSLKTLLRRVYRDIRRKLQDKKELIDLFHPLLVKADKLAYGDPKSSSKIYSIHEEQVQCISKGKARVRYEFGCKVSLVITHKQGLALSCQALSGHPYDGHTLKDAIADAEQRSGQKIKRAVVDKGYVGHGASHLIVYKSGQKRGVKTREIKCFIKRRQAIEPHIGHMKSDDKLSCNFLKGFLGDQINGILCGVGHNLRLLFNFFQKQQVFT
jgi:transposase, IS5 family